LALITNLPGKVAHQEAFSVKTPKTAQKTPISYLKNGSSYELLLPLILIRMATFYCNISNPHSIDGQKTPKTAENRQNRQKTPIPYLKNGSSYVLLLPLILIIMGTF
jgi:hypothetical protein